MALNEIVLRGLVTEAGDEMVSEEAITPGELVEINTSTGKLRKHATATGRSARWFAVMAPYYGMANVVGTPAINTAFTSGDTVPFLKAHAGHRINAWLEGSHAAVAKGALLESGGGGNLQAGTTNPIAVCAVAHAGTDTARARIIVDIL